MSSNWLVFNRREFPIVMNIGGTRIEFAPHERKRFDDTDDRVIENMFGATANWVCIKLNPDVEPVQQIIVDKPIQQEPIVKEIPTEVSKQPQTDLNQPQVPVKRKAGRPKGSGVKVK